MWITISVILGIVLLIEMRISSRLKKELEIYRNAYINMVKNISNVDNKKL
ncbi:DUF1514 domain-containing protein [Staphylococcus delphini]|nr:DUF1514 domain-containing protein [Staphylococcus delphini]